MISSLPLKLGEQERRQRMVISIEITNAQGEKRTERALFDSGAEENYIL